MPLMTNETMNDPYVYRVNCIDRLREEIERYGTLFVAFDFDNTVFDYHGKGFRFDAVEGLLRNCKLFGFKLILFTAKESQEELNECVAYCKKRGYEPDFINENPLMNTKKPYYNILLDDRAGLGDACECLATAMLQVQSEKMKSL